MRSAARAMLIARGKLMLCDLWCATSVGGFQLDKGRFCCQQIVSACLQLSKAALSVARDVLNICLVLATPMVLTHMEL